MEGDIVQMQRRSARRLLVSDIRKEETRAERKRQLAELGEVNQHGWVAVRHPPLPTPFLFPRRPFPPYTSLLSFKVEGRL